MSSRSDCIAAVAPATIGGAAVGEPLQARAAGGPDPASCPSLPPSAMPPVRCSRSPTVAIAEVIRLPLTRPRQAGIEAQRQNCWGPVRRCRRRTTKLLF
eukprot:357554-Chlamydomonas_euryale.AAC.8